MPPHPHFRRPAFTLVELLIVVAILGIIAAIVLPTIRDVREQARREAFAANLRDLAGVAKLYFEDWHALPPQGAGAAVPPELLRAAGRGDFPSRTPIGGYWHLGHFAAADRWGVGVWWDGDAEQDVRRLAQSVDAEFDDGRPDAGRFLFDGGRYYWMID